MIILKSKDGSIAIMTLVDGANKEEAIQKFQEVHPDYMDVYEGNFKLPEDRQFRDAWTLKNNKIVVDNKKVTKMKLNRDNEKENLLKELESLKQKINTL